MTEPTVHPSAPAAGTAGPRASEAGQAAVRGSEKLLAERTDIPDGPNVAPSPLEHLAAQGIVAGPAQPVEKPAPGVAEKTPSAGSSGGADPVEPMDPAEQGLVEEQRARDSAAARHSSPPPSKNGPGDGSGA